MWMFMWLDAFRMKLNDYQLESIVWYSTGITCLFYRLIVTCNQLLLFLLLLRVEWILNKNPQSICRGFAEVLIEDELLFLFVLFSSLYLWQFIFFWINNNYHKLRIKISSQFIAAGALLASLLHHPKNSLIRSTLIIIKSIRICSGICYLSSLAADTSRYPPGIVLFS